MRSIYRCKNENRRVLIMAPPSGGVINGIDYLEVLHDDAFAGTAAQQTLLVRLFLPAPGGADALGRDNARVLGGVRTTKIDVQWVHRADDVTSVPTAEADFYAALPDPDHVLVVRVDPAGDFSTYQLQLISDTDAGSPPEGFDPILSRIDFSFKVECPSDFDCVDAVVCPPAPQSSPVIDYLAKDYAGFRRVLLDRLSVILPHWRERNPADSGIAVVEALAYTADHLSYFQDAIATETYLGTARRRTSVRRHARLLDYMVHDGCNARAFVRVEVDDDHLVLARVAGNRRTRLFTAVDAPPALTDEQAARVLREQRPVVFEPMHDAVLYRAHNRIPLHTWGDDDCCLPRGATSATLRDDLVDRLRLVPGDVLFFEETTSPTPGLPPDPERRHAVRLTHVHPAATVDSVTMLRTPSASPITDPITGDAIVHIEWHPDDALPFPLCVTTPETPEVSVAGGNVVLVDHGSTIHTPEALPAPIPDRLYRPGLAGIDLTHVVAYDDETARSGRLSATASTKQDPRRALAALALDDGVYQWTVRRDLLGSSRTARDVVVEMEDDSSATLRFGDGVLGRRPSDALEATYRVGQGVAGNVGSDSIAHIVWPNAAVTRVYNPRPASGGVAAESIQEVKLYAPQAFRRNLRAVTEADYAALASAYPDVQRAVATRRWTGSWYTMFVTVDRRGGRSLDAAFREGLLSYLDRFRLAGYDLELALPEYVPLDVRLVVCVERDHVRTRVRRDLLRVFSDGDTGDGRRGFFHPDNFTFGQPVYFSQLVDAAMSVPGVRWIDRAHPRAVFQRFAEPPNGELENGVIEMARLEIARLDNSPSRPENGRIDFELMGGR